jgi:hypothetical protein
MRWAEYVVLRADKRNEYRIVVRKRPLGRPRRRFEDNIKMDLKDIGWSGMDWIDMPHDRDQWKDVVNTVMNLRVPLKVCEILE